MITRNMAVLLAYYLNPNSVATRHAVTTLKGTSSTYRSLLDRGLVETCDLFPFVTVNQTGKDELEAWRVAQAPPVSHTPDSVKKLWAHTQTTEPAKVYTHDEVEQLMAETRQAERERIVAWVRELSKVNPSATGQVVLHTLAEMIENGEQK